MKTLFIDKRRPAQKPAAGLPFGIRSAGHDIFTPPFQSNRKMLHFVQIFWCANGKATIGIQGRRRDISRHQVAVYFPGMEHYFQVDQCSWDCYWLTMDGPLAEQIVSAYGLLPDIYKIGPPPVKTFEALIEIVTRPDKQSELVAGVKGYGLLSQLTRAHHHSDTLVAEAVDILNRSSQELNFNIKTLAAKLQASPSTLSTRFSMIMGVTPSAYLERLRIERALSLIRFTRRPIKAIAHECGYPDANYFSRVIRRITSHTPKELRPPLSVCHLKKG